jgi:hypothetical protein
MSYPAEPIGMYGMDGKPCARVDLTKASVVDNVSIDDIVTVIVTGKVKALRGRDEYKTHDYDDKGKKGKEITRVNPGSIEIEVSDMRVAKKGEFDGMLED